jgi:peptidoglycan/xylan/chitin deacetylase (PgdA/CDA1 family)
MTLSRGVKDMLGRFAAARGAYARYFGSRMTVVAFHRVTDEMPEDDLTCGVQKFEVFCRFFKRHFRVLSLAEQVALISSGADAGGTLSITFDDGYLDNVTAAAPILRKLQLPATFFIATGFIGSHVIPPWDQNLAQQPGWMSWDDVRSLVAQGFEIGGHGHGHIDMGCADANSVRQDLETAQRILAKEIGHTSRLFAYPFGGRNNLSARSRELVRQAGFSCCAACYGGLNPAIPDPFSLQRVGIARWFATPNQLAYELMAGKA